LLVVGNFFGYPEQGYPKKKKFSAVAIHNQKIKNNQTSAIKPQIQSCNTQFRSPDPEPFRKSMFIHYLPTKLTFNRSNHFAFRYF